MKLVKFVPALAATLVLAACSTATNNDMAKEAASMNAEGNKTTVTATAKAEDITVTAAATKEVLMTQTKSVAYKCNSGNVVVAYAFHNDEVKGANVRLGKNNEITGFLANAELTSKVGSPVFVSGDYVLTSDNGLTFANATKTDLVMVTKGDQILAKNCKIQKAATKKLNK